MADTLAERVWQLKKENRELQKEIEDMMEREHRLKELPIQTSRSGEVKVETMMLLDEKRRLLEMTIPSEEATHKNKLSDLQSLEESVEASRSTLRELQHQNVNLRKGLSTKESLLRDINRDNDSRMIQIQTERSQLLSTINTTEHSLSLIQEEYNSLKPSELVQDLVSSLSAYSDPNTVSLQQYEILKEETNSLYNRLLGLGFNP